MSYYTQAHYNEMLIEHETVSQMNENDVRRSYNADSKQDIIDIIEDEIRIYERLANEGEIRLTI
ncbi:hypothetical protein EZS27_027500 [termite gut metagenome]|jgi:hypothetical protein|uniref:Uncharacterized protein n=1 Tax=termite gut metagenome TaxID=433724 RepID=A0A5J4QPU7_9ZZZZ